MRKLLIFGTLAALALLLVLSGSAFSGVAQAAVQTTAGITFTGPDTYQSCVNATTHDAITIKNVPAGDTLVGMVDVQYVTNSGRQEIHTYTVNQTGDLNLLISYPPVSQWPVLSNGTREIHVDVSISVYDSNGNLVALFDGLQGGQNDGWDVYCNGSAPEGCSPGFWKTHTGLGVQANAWVGYTPSTTFMSVFGVAPAGLSANATLLQVLKAKGGGAIAMDRHAVSALLNSTSLGSSYPLSTLSIISLVQYAYATGQFGMVAGILEGFEEPCPLS